MADNRAKYGFRYYMNLRGGGMPPAVECFVASAYAANFGAGTVGISIGDPVEKITDGSVILADDTDTDPGRVFGVVVGISNARIDINGKSKPANFLPPATSYTTKEGESRLLVLPVAGIVWEVDADAQTATTEAAWRALMGLNCPISSTRDTSNPDKPKMNPRAATGTTGTGTDHLRLWDISKTRENADLSGANVKLLVMFNEGSDPSLSVTGL